MNAERYYHEMNLYKQNQAETSSLVKNEKKSSENEELTDVVTIPDFSSDRFQNIEVDENSVVKAKSTVETSTFTYKRHKENEQILGKLPLLDNDDDLKSFIAHCAKSATCKNSVTFVDNEETLSWKELIVSMLKFIYQEKVDNIEVTLKNHKIFVEGEFQKSTIKKEFLSLISSYDTTYQVVDNSTVYVEKKEENLTKISDLEMNTTKVVSAEPLKVQEKVKDVNQSMILEEQITKLLAKGSITFRKNKGAIRLSGRRILDKIAKLLLGKKQFLVMIEGHTDAGGKAKINMMISKARAISVKRYLIKKGLKEEQIMAKGYGETKLLSSKNPYSRLNRRVEIHIKELK